MGTRFEIEAWTPFPSRNGTQYHWETIWGGSSRLKCVAAFVVALMKPNHPPLRLVWR